MDFTDGGKKGLNKSHSHLRANWPSFIRRTIFSRLKSERRNTAVRYKSPKDTSDYRLQRDLTKRKRFRKYLV